MSISKKSAITKGTRVYEYHDQDGNLFWSFKKFPGIVTPSRILTLGDRVGQPFESYLAELRATRRILIEDEKDEALKRK